MDAMEQSSTQATVWLSSACITTANVAVCKALAPVNLQFASFSMTDLSLTKINWLAFEFFEVGARRTASCSTSIFSVSGIYSANFRMLRRLRKRSIIVILFKFPAKQKKMPYFRQLIWRFIHLPGKDLTCSGKFQYWF